MITGNEIGISKKVKTVAEKTNVHLTNTVIFKTNPNIDLRMQPKDVQERLEYGQPAMVFWRL
jgi:hypothetical protein